MAAAGTRGRLLFVCVARSLGALCVALALCAPARAQPAPAATSAPPLPPTATFTHVTIEQGLADQIATEITQDSEGFMWFGTFNGLDRYDGYRFVHYRHEDADPHSLSGNVVTALYTDRAGSVWVGSRGAGLSRFDPRTQQFQVFRHDPADPTSLSSDSPHMLYQDRAGVLWIASEGGLSRFSPETGTFTNYTHVEGDPNTIVSNARFGQFRKRRLKPWPLRHADCRPTRTYIGGRDATRQQAAATSNLFNAR